MRAVVLGLMSGTSLDGLDLALVEFELTNETMHWSFLKTETVDYSSQLIADLDQAPQLSGKELRALDVAYGKWLGKTCNRFISQVGVRPDIIASHGHTVFHEPNHGYTLQIGDGNYLAAETGIDTICDFRSLDMAFGGQGAPLVPMGDQWLFKAFDHRINLGGIANISSQNITGDVAFDVCPFNLLLNRYSQLLGVPFDDKGALARNGRLDQDLLQALNAHPYFSKLPPKSLDKNWLLKEFIPLIDQHGLKPSAILRTLVEHFAIQVGRHLPTGRVLLSGGGTHHHFFVERLKQQCAARIEIPSEEIINFKEALIFALLGFLRLKEIPNVLTSATGANKSVCGGVLIKAP